MFSPLIKKSIRDLTKKKLRTILTVLTIAFGVMGIALFAVTPLADQTVENAIKSENLSNINITVSDVDIGKAELKELMELDNVSGVDARVVFMTDFMDGKEKKTAIVLGSRAIDDQTVDKVTLSSGSEPRGGEVLTDEGNIRNGIIESERGDSVKILDYSGKEQRLNIVGKARNFRTSGATSQGNAVFHTDIETARDLSNLNGYNSLSFSLSKADGKSIDKAVEDIREYLVENTSVVAFAQLPELRLEGTWLGREIFQTIVGFLGVLGFLILFVSTFLISNTMNTMVAEQSRDIAQMKALGATKFKVFRSFSLTSLILGVVGSLLGATMGVFISYYVLLQFGGRMFGMDPQFSVHIPTVAISVAIGVTVVIVSSLPALFRSLRVTVMEGMESHGISSNYGNSVIDKLLMKVQGIPRVTQMGIRNAIRRKGRSISTALQIAFAVGIVLSMLAFGDTLISVTIDTYANEKQDIATYLVTDANNPMTVDKVASLEEIKGVKSIEPFIRTNAKINDRSVPAYGLVYNTGSTNFEKTLLKDGEGRFWTEEEEENKEKVAVVGTALAKLEGLKLNGNVEVMTATGPQDFKIIGIDSGFTDNGQRFYAPLSTVQSVLGKGDTINGVYLWTTSSKEKEIDKVATRIEDRLVEDGYKGDVVIGYVQEANNISQNQAMANLFLTVSFIVVLITLIGLVSTLIMNVLDRTKEIGMLRTVGAKSRDIRRIFRAESVFLTLIGWVIGLPIGYLVYQVILNFAEQGMKLTLPSNFPIRFIFVSFFITLVATILIISLPIRRATHLKTGDALKYE